MSSYTTTKSPLHNYMIFAMQNWTIGALLRFSCARIMVRKGGKNKIKVIIKIVKEYYNVCMKWDILLFIFGHAHFYTIDKIMLLVWIYSFCCSHVKLWCCCSPDKRRGWGWGAHKCLTFFLDSRNRCRAIIYYFYLESLSTIN